MPRGDGTGSMGMGPMPGRAAGWCAGYSMPGFENTVPGKRWLGMRRGRGCGSGWRNRWGINCDAASRNQVSVAADEINLLKNQAKSLSEALEKINIQISNFQTQKK